MYLAVTARVGVWIGVVLIPTRTGRHGQNIAQRDAVISGAGELRCEIADDGIDTGDQAAPDRHADKCGDERLGDGPARP